ncbi:hypothetical protein HWV62_20786 [Athelia sp. TMB]|nr:hypothetical protein HWV62_20786 [Athelia sp. TMB]
MTDSTLITTLSCPGAEKAPTVLDTGDNIAQRDTGAEKAPTVLDTGDNSAQQDTGDNNAQLDMGDNIAQASSRGDGEAVEDYGDRVPSAQAAGDVAAVNSSHGDIHDDRASPSQDAGDASMETSSDAEVEAIVFRDEPDKDELDELQSKPDSSSLAQPKEGGPGTPSSPPAKRKQKGPGRRAPAQDQPYTICTYTKSCKTPLTADEIDDRLSRCQKHRLRGAAGSQRFREKKASF